MNRGQKDSEMYVKNKDKNTVCKISKWNLEETKNHTQYSTYDTVLYSHFKYSVKLGAGTIYRHSEGNYE